jgi:hypothetical protein
MVITLLTVAQSIRGHDYSSLPQCTSNYQQTGL